MLINVIKSRSVDSAMDNILHLHSIDMRPYDQIEYHNLDVQVTFK